MSNLNNSESGNPTFLRHVLTVTIKEPLPSLNVLLAMSHWERTKLKRSIQKSFLSGLQAIAADSSTKTTSSPSTTSTPLVIADLIAGLSSYLQTHRPKHTSRSARFR